MSARREMQQLVMKLERQGFSVTRSGSGHWIVRPPSGSGMVVLGFSPNNSNFSKSLIRLRKLGYDPEK